MARKLKPYNMQSGLRGGTILGGVIVIGGSGAISSVTGFLPVTTVAGTFGVIKTAAKTGRYSLVLDRIYKVVRVVGVTIEGPADTAMGNTNANAACVRNVTTSALDIQLFLASSGADTDAASGYKIHWSVEVGVI